ncbi:hypothetical protein IWW51_000651 [Coemansia sp. RSA 2702]|nr:hypothetical protein IWW51_000651 [Coemansia sp. RSA 2702]
MHGRRTKQAAVSWAAAYSRAYTYRLQSAEQRRSLSELYNRMEKKPAAKNTKKDGVEGLPGPSISAIPRPKIHFQKIEPSAGSKQQAREPNQQLKDPKAAADEYIAKLPKSKWNGEKTWARFSQLPRESLARLRDIDVNRTLANIRGADKTLAQGERAVATTMTLNRMLEVFEKTKQAGVVPDKYTYQELIAINVDLLNFDYAHEWLDKMVQQGITPTIRPYRTILKGYGATAGMLDNARRFWQEIKTKLAAGQIAADDSSEPMRSIDMPTYTCYIAAEAKAGDFAKVVGVLEEMEQAGITPDITVRNTILDGIVRHRGLDAGLREAELMAESGYELNGYSYAPLLNAAISEQRHDDIRALLAAAAAKNIVPAVHTIRRVPFDPFETLEIMSGLQSSHQVRLYNALIETAMRTNDFGRVLQLIDHLRQRGVAANVVTYTLLLDALNKAGRLEQAKSMFAKVFNGGELKPDAYIYSIMIDACGRQGDVRSMLWFKNDMQRQGLAVSEPIYNSVLSALARWRHGNLQAVMVVADELERAKPAVRPTCRTFSAIFAAAAAQAQTRTLGAGELEFVRSWYRHAGDRYYVAKDSFVYFMALSAFIGARCLPDAMAVFADMLRDYERNRLVADGFVRKPNRMLDLMKLALGQQEFGAALEIWNHWLQLRLPPIPKAAELALFACDQMGQPDMARAIIYGLLTPDASPSAGCVFCPQIVDESVLGLYMAAMIKHGQFDELLPALRLWAGVATKEEPLVPKRQLSESTVSKIVRLLRRSKHPEAPALIGQLLTLVDEHFPGATPI